MLTTAVRLAVLVGIWLAGLGQVDSRHEPRPSSEPPPVPLADSPGAIVEVVSPELEVYDRADPAAYVTGSLSRGDRVKVREAVEGGWLAIDPTPTTICWIERSAIELGNEPGGASGHILDRGGSTTSPPERAWVVANRAEVRSGHSQARMPGPPKGYLPQGTMVRLVDRPPLVLGRGRSTTLWYAIVPPTGEARYVRAEGTNWPKPSPHRPTTETLTAYETEENPRPEKEKPKPPAPALPADLAAEIENADTMHRSITINQPIDQWRFDAVRARYQALLKRYGDNPAVEEILRDRLAGVTRHEQAAEAARTIQTVLAESRRRDRQVAELRRRLAASERARPRPYSAVGFVEPSSRMVDGRKLYVLIGADGSTVAYLDIPPGIDPDSLSTRRVGVRGPTHYNQDLGTRLITVRDMESIESRR